MLCIITFILFLIFFPILGFFPEYRRLFRRSWQCFFKRVTFQPCDIDLGTELKSKFLGKLIFRWPRVAKFIDKTFSFWVFLFVILNIWSLWYTALAGLNLWVYDTCEPISGEGCALSGEACGVATNQLTFTDAIRQDRVVEWGLQPWNTFTDTVSRVPNRLKNWEPKDYLASTATYYQKYDKSKKVALEVIDPSCQFCGKLFQNIKESKFYEKYNLSYLLYPIPSSVNKNGYRFQHSYLMSRYVEATKKVILNNSEISGDWLLLEKYFTAKGDYSSSLQEDFRSTYSNQQAEDKIKSLLKEIGYSSEEVSKISDLAKAEEVKNNLSEQTNIVSEKIRTIKIPTIIFNGRRWDRVVDVETLRKS